MCCLIAFYVMLVWVELFLIDLSIFYSSMLKPQMPPRRAPEDNNNNNNNEAMMQQMMAAQTQLMTMMAQFMANQHGPPPPPPPPQVDRLARFLRLRPNKFSTTTDPIVADDWLRSVQKDLVTAECEDAEKIRFTDRKSVV